MYFNKLNKWVLNESSDVARMAAFRIAGDLSISVPTAKLLVNRGCNSTADAKRFISKEQEQLYNPFLMKDMEKAAERVADAILAEERIVIYGDYDVDGVTSVASLYLYLKSHGADVSYHIPCRMTEGYGINKGVIEKLKEDECDVIITVDTGITAIEEIAFAKSLGIDVVVTDHHECHEILPDAYAVVNPCRHDCTYPFKELAGVGVIFKLMCAVESVLNPDDSLSVCTKRIAKEYCDLVALGTVADVMPVIDENRLIVSYGLLQIENGTRLSLNELILASGSESKYATKKKITAAYVGYTLAPRINAAGRIKSASIAVELLLSDNIDDARRYAHELCAINKLRQQEENRITEEAYAKIADEHNFDTDPVIVLADEKWHHGIIGIVSSRITEKYGLPSILISFDGNGEDKSPDDFGKGSGRSIKGFNLVEALGASSDYLVKYGGHELAAGLTVKRDQLESFKKSINDFVNNSNGSVQPEVTIEAECLLEVEDINMNLATELYYLEPYGTLNPVPVFRTDALTVVEVFAIGGGKHTKLTLRRGNMNITAMCFRMSLAELDLYPGDTVDVLYNLDINEFQGIKSLQMIVKDIRLTESELKREIREHKIFDSLYHGEKLDFELTDEEKSACIPTRDDFAAVYSTLKRELRVEHEVFSIRALAHLMNSCGHNIPYIRLKFIIMIFRELNLIGVEELDAEKEIYSFKYIFVKNKVNLEKASIFKKLKSELKSGDILSDN